MARGHNPVKHAKLNKTLPGAGRGIGDALGTVSQAARLARQAPKKVRSMLQAGHRHVMREEWAKAAKCYFDAWDHLPEDLEVLTMLAHCLGKLGARRQALDILEKAITIHGGEPRVYEVMGHMCAEMHLYDIAAKVCRQAVELWPDKPEFYALMFYALVNLERYDEVIDTAQAVLPLFPAHAMLWNELGSAVRMRDGPQQALEFYEEAVRLAPDNARIVCNLAMVMPPDRERDRIDLFRKALSLNSDLPEAHIAIGYHHLSEGRLAEGWRHYEWRKRLTRAKGQRPLYQLDIPEWQGAGDKVDCILVAAEQGLGDEIMFARAIPQLIERVKTVIIACDPRLVGIFARSFPQAHVISYRDEDVLGDIRRHFPDLEGLAGKGVKPEAYVPCGSLPYHVWPDIDCVPICPSGYLTPDPELVEKWRARLSAIGDGRKVGISWKSGMTMGARRFYYTSLPDFLPLAVCEGVHLVNLQYGDVGEDIAGFEEKSGACIHRWDDFDVRQDIENNLALMSVLDFVVGPQIAPQMMATSVGTQVRLLMHVDPWWALGTAAGGDGPSFMPNMRFVNVADYGWQAGIDAVAREVAALQKTPA